jgi:hypothetical protein
MLEFGNTWQKINMQQISTGVALLQIYYTGTISDLC